MIRIILLSTFLTFLACNRDTTEIAHTPDPPARVTQPAGNGAAIERRPEQVVEEFGRRMKQVSTTAAPDIAATSIRTAYAGLVAPNVLESWARTPADAPGRQVSSPWPERIEIASTSHSGDEAIVDGTVVEMTSTGEAGRTPVRIRLQRSSGTWLITGYETAPRAQTEPDNDDAQAAVAVLREYYRAISAREYRRAFALWGSSGPPGQDLQRFTAGFAETESVTVEPGPASRVEGAAGSRYVEVPVSITATNSDGSQTRYEGTYTLRRSVVDGAPEPDRVWHLYRASIRTVAG